MIEASAGCSRRTSLREEGSEGHNFGLWLRYHDQYSSRCRGRLCYSHTWIDRDWLAHNLDNDLDNDTEWG
jgi:hypothetical protein